MRSRDVYSIDKPFNPKDWPREVDTLTTNCGARIEYAHWHPEKSDIYKLPEGMRAFCYKCEYSTDHAKGERTAYVGCYSLADFLELLAIWSSMNPKQYKYSPILPYC